MPPYGLLKWSFRPLVGSPTFDQDLHLYCLKRFQGPLLNSPKLVSFQRQSGSEKEVKIMGPFYL